MGDGAVSSILVIDSGIGGLSICEAILKRLPEIEITYFADKAYFPYGLMSESDLISRLHEIVDAMLSEYQPELVVLACNTVSTLVLPELRECYDVPFVGVVPAIKPAALHSQTKRIGLLATPATVRRVYTDELIRDFATDCEVVRVGTNDLVVQAEAMANGLDVSEDVLFEVLKPFLRSDTSKVDTIVLGCTHFPFLKKYLDGLVSGINWVDSGEAIARRVQGLLEARGLRVDQRESPVHHIYFSGDLPVHEGFSQFLSSLGFKEFELRKSLI